MYHTIVKRKVRASFEKHLAAGDYEAVLKDFAPDVRYTFAGDNALGGTRHSRDGVRRWFQRLFVVFPKLRFEIGSLLVKGWPWNTTIVLEWTDRAEPSGGSAYVNEGVHVMRMRWGRVIAIHAYLDTEKMSRTCARLAEHGLAEAGAEQIVT